MKNKKKNIIAAIGVILSFLAIIGFIIYAKKLVDSDFASDMILGQICAEENTILTPSFYYSTEVRVLHTELIMGLLFKFFTNWHVIRVLTGVIVNILLLAAYFYCCKKSGLSRYAMYFAPVLLLPFSLEYLQFVQFGYYYMPHIIISFWMFGLIFSLMQDKKSKTKWITWGIYMVFSFLAGLGTIRQLIIFYYPLCLAMFILCLMDYRKNAGFAGITFKKAMDYIKSFKSNRYVRYFYITIAGAFVASVGYVCNVVILRRLYSFYSYDRIEFADFDMSRISRTIDGYLAVFGYNSGAEFLSAYGIGDVLAILLVGIVIYTVYRLAKKLWKLDFNNQIFVVYFICAVAVNSFIFIFSEMFAERYMLPYIIFFIIIANIYISDKEFIPFNKNVILTAIIGIVVINSALSYLNWIGKEQSSIDRQPAADYLMAEGYTYGYASFWNANVFTETTNGVIEMRAISAEEWDTFGYDHWLMRKSYETRTSEDPVFVMVTHEELEAHSDLPYLDTQYQIYEDDTFVIFSFDSTYDLFEIAGVQ